MKFAFTYDLNPETGQSIATISRNRFFKTRKKHSGKLSKIKNNYNKFHINISIDITHTLELLQLNLLMFQFLDGLSIPIRIPYQKKNENIIIVKDLHNKDILLKVCMNILISELYDHYTNMDYPEKLPF